MSNMVQRIVVCLLVALPVSFTGEKQKKDQSNDMHEKEGDSFFSQQEGPYPQTCEKDAGWEVRLFRNPLFMFICTFLLVLISNLFKLNLLIS